MYETDHWLRRRPGAGLLLLLFVLAALALPLWYFRGNDHPLAGETSVALCQRLEGLLLPGLVAATGRQSGVAGVCIWRNEQGQIPFEATFTTTRNSSPRGVDKVFDSLRNNVVAFGADGLVESGETGSRTLRYCRGDNCEWLIEDHGVLLWLRAFRMSDVMFDEVARAATATLREPAQAP
jgi:hypothetical protein